MMKSDVHFEPLADRVVVRQSNDPTSASKKMTEAIVVAVGPGGRAPDGSLIPIPLAPGDRVVIDRYSGIELDGGFSIVREWEIVARVSAGARES